VRRLEPRERRHLRTRLDLEDANGLRLLEHLVNGRIVSGIWARSNRDSGFGIRDSESFADVFTSSIASCKTAIMPRPSRSTLTIPISAQSSLSH
jgi:hypothetical protein